MEFQISEISKILVNMEFNPKVNLCEINLLCIWPGKYVFS